MRLNLWQRGLGSGMAIALSLPAPGTLWAAATIQPNPLDLHRRPSLHLAQGQSLDQEADALMSQGAQQLQRRQIEAALQSWEQALRLYRRSGNRRGEGRVLGNRGAVQEALGNYREAIAAFADSLDIAREIGDTQGIAFALSNLGHTHERLAEYDIALGYQEQALAYARQRGDRPSEQEALNALGILYKATGNYEQAVATYERSLALARELGDRRGEANVLGNLGNAYADLGNYPQAIALYEAALPLLQAIDNALGEAAILQRLGNVSSEVGNPTQALRYYEQSLEMARELRDPALELFNLGSIGILHRQAGELETALSFLQQAQQRAEQLGDREALGAVFNSLGNTYVALADWAAAREAFEQSRAIAQTIGDPRLEGITLGGLALTADRSGDDALAIDLYEQSLERSQAVGDRVREGQALSNLGLVHYERGNLAAAARALFAAVDIWESLRPGLSDENQVSLFESQATAYRVLQMVLIDLKQVDKALEISEQGRARAFIELVAKRLSAQAAEELQTDPPTLEEIRAIAQTQNAALVQYSLLENDRIAIWVIQPDGQIDFRETSLNALDTRDLSVEDIAEQTRVAAATGRGSRTTQTQVSVWVQNLRRSITQLNDLTAPVDAPPAPADSRSQRAISPTETAPTSPRRANRRLQRLHTLLIEPIADLLPSSPEEQVIIIPQGSLFLVPFAALQNKEDLSYLIERHTLSTAPALQVLALTHTQRQRQRETPTTQNTLIIGNPTMPTIGTPPAALSPLPNAEQEAIAIGQLMNSTPLLGAVATENRVVQQMPTARIIHFATHGLLDDVEGLGVPGAIALSPSLTRDGLLTANEILDLRLNAELVVLSACDTGRGRITGDGVIGLSRSFISAGASSIVVSLWAVPDDATAVLMTEFYRNLGQTPNKAQALRQAMLVTMQQFPNSRDWAAFTLIGEAN